MRKRAFTLLELMIVVIIVGILGSLSIPVFQGAVIKAKMVELYTTVDVIEKAEEMYYAECGKYAAHADGIDGGNLPYSISQDEIDNFRDILGVEIPGMDSVFVYGVYYEHVDIYVRVRGHHDDWGWLCYKRVKEGTWLILDAHPWAKYLHIPGAIRK